jgi:hypothetical protein
LRLERERVILGRKAPSSLKVEPLIPPVTLPLDPRRYHEVRVERQATQWRAFVDDRLIGTTPLAEGESPVFRISVESPAEDQLTYFADFLVEELAAP